MNTFRLFELPPELILHIFGCVADASELKELLRLRHVSKPFDSMIMHGTVFPRATSYMDIVGCEDKNIILKYLRWYHDSDHWPPLAEMQHHLYDENLELNEVSSSMRLLNECARKFHKLSGGKYSFTSILAVVHNLFAQQLIAQRLQSHPDLYSSHEWRFDYPNLIWWCQSSLPSNHTAENDRIQQQACIAIACAMGDDELLEKACRHIGPPIEALHDDPLDEDHILGRPLQAALWQRQHKLIQGTLLQKCQLVYSPGWSALKDAVLIRDYETLACLIHTRECPQKWRQASTSYRETGNTVGDALVLACKLNDRTAFDILYSQVAQPLPLRALEYMLFSACSGGAEDTGLHILQLYPCMNLSFRWRWASGKWMCDKPRTQRYILADAAAHGCTSLVKTLLQRGTAVMPNVLRYTPFHPIEAACHYGHAACLEVLLTAGATERGVGRALYWPHTPNPRCIELLSPMRKALDLRRQGLETAS